MSCYEEEEYDSDYVSEIDANEDYIVHDELLEAIQKSEMAANGEEYKDLSDEEPELGCIMPTKKQRAGLPVLADALMDFDAFDRFGRAYAKVTEME